MNYYRIEGEHGTYILSRKEMDIAIDRENNGLTKNVLSEIKYSMPLMAAYELNDDEEDTELTAAHTEFALENKAEFLNYGWATGENFIHSKTDKGRIYTSRDDKGIITNEFTE